MDEQKKRVYLRAIVEAGIGAGMVALAMLLGPLGFEILLPFLVAFVMAWLFNPVVHRLQSRLGSTRKLYSFIMVLVFYAIVGMALVYFAMMLVEQVLGLSRSLPTFIETLQNVYHLLIEYVKQLLEHMPDGYEMYEAQVLSALDTAWQWVVSALTRLLSRVAGYASGVAVALPENVIFLTVLILASCFITAEFPNLRQNLYQRMTPGTRRSVDLLLRSLRAALTGFFRSQLIFAIIDMGIILTFFFFMKVPYPLPIALLLAFLDFIPFFGAGTIIVPWGCICLLIGLTNMGVQLLILYGILYVFRRIFEPRILGGQTGFSSLQMLFAMYAGMRLAGLTGLVVAPIVWIAAVDFCRTGIFDGIVSDWKVIIGDIRALTARPELEREIDERLAEKERNQVKQPLWAMFKKRKPGTAEKPHSRKKGKP